jgi:hypothetical protein
MRIQNVRASRPDWYDRNPVMVGNIYGGDALAPHALTTRFTYTVPTGKKCYLEYGQLKVTRDGATATPVKAGCDFPITAGISTTPILGIASIISGTLGATDNQTLGAAIILVAAFAFTGSTFDTSTGGTCGYIVTFKGTEFDA